MMKYNLRLEEKLQATSCRLLLAGYLLGLVFVPEDGDSIFVRNVGEHLSHYTTSHL
jgi:predicted acyltransferase